jgi:hypothetical protein
LHSSERAIEIELADEQPTEPVRDSLSLSARCANWRPDEPSEIGQDDDPIDCLRAKQYRQVERGLRREESNR